MELSELQGLAEKYGKALLEELERKQDLASAELELESVVAAALEMAMDAGDIDGKNAEARKIQSASVVANNKVCGVCRELVNDAQCSLGIARAGCARIDAEVGLTKAWLYSQARIG